jgi:hypothetical protein
MKAVRIPDADQFQIEEIAKYLGSDLPIGEVVRALTGIYEIGHKQHQIEVLQRTLTV